MRTDHVSANLVDYVSGKLDAEARLQVEAHVRECQKCQLDLKEVSDALEQVKEFRDKAPSPSYFSSIVPRLREHLDGKAPMPWFDSPAFSKLVLPFATATVAIVLLVNIGGLNASNGTDKALSPLVEGMNPEDVVDMVMQDSPSTPWVTSQTQEVAQAVVSDHLTKGHFLQNALSMDLQSYFTDASLISSQQLLQNLDEEQIETLLKKLEERSSL
ncbi:MAG: zf-HC2 domain-containing protein [Ignavibacteriales bacterium]|nr:zf-HC2 domain-containing protein [Ignavibacteriales bacterium]